ncbi:MAG: ATP-binding protein [Gracilimonas sp.]|nr:ATP-binding protein [Gracilimonas sp.]
MFKSYSRHIKAVAQLASKINSLKTVEDIAWTITQEIIEYLNFEDCVIYTVDHNQKILKQVAAYGPKRKSKGEIKNPIEIKLGKHIVGEVALTGKSELINDTTAEKRYLVDDEQRYSELTVPIKVKGKVIGIIDSEHSEKNFFDKNDLETVSAIANIVSIQLQSAIEQEQNSRKFEELEELLSLMLNHSKSAILFEDVNHKIILVNQAFCSAINTDKNPNQLIGTSTLQMADTFSNIFPNKDAFVERIKELKDKNETVYNEEIHIEGDRHFSRDFVPINFEGNIIGYYWQYNDITEKVNALDKAENALKLEKRFNKMNKTLVSLASHEFRTPLTSIKSTVDLLLSNADKFDKDAIIHRLKRISRASDNMNVLLDDILDLGKLENFKNEKPSIEWISVDDIKQMVEEITIDFMPERKIKLNLKMEGSFQAKTRKSKLYLIIKNLLINADKYSNECSRIELNIQQDRKKTMISVKDMGIGIPKNQLDTIFDPFERGSNTKNTNGTGLGLYIAKRATEIIKGNLTIQSKINSGTTVTLSFPTQ